MIDPGFSLKGQSDEAFKRKTMQRKRFNILTLRRFIAVEIRSLTSTITRDARPARSRRWKIFRGRIIWRNRHPLWRDLFQHRDDRLSGSADRSLLSGPDRGHDLSANRKLRNQLARSGKPFAACPRIRDRRTERGAEQLALRTVAKGILAEMGHPRRPG